MRNRKDLLRERVEEFTTPLRQAEAGRVRAVHRARVASRRLREILPVVGADAGECRRALKRLRQVAHQLGRLRELDVSAGLLDAMRDPARGQSPGVGLLRERLSEVRREAFDKAETKGFGHKLRRTARQLEHVVEGLSDDTPSRNRGWRRTLDARVASRARALLAAIDEAGREFVPERVHHVRIQLKKLRYAVELSDEASGRPATADWRRLADSQSRLGRLHDRLVLMAWVEDVRTSLGARHLRARRDLGALLVDLEAECRVLHAAYVRSRPVLREAGRRILARTEGLWTTRGPVQAHNRLRQVRLA